MTSLVVFADSRLKGTLRRISKEARASKFFSNIYVSDEYDLNEEFKIKFEPLLKSEVRGFGYWVWKSQIILQALENLPPDEILVYLDAGCHISKKGKKRFDEYIQMLATSSENILCFELTCTCGEIHAESSWTKGDVFDYFGAIDDKNIFSSPQICATIFMVKNNQMTKQFMYDWQQCFTTLPPIFDDSPSFAPNFPDFIENRHDQSVFSLLVKRASSIKLSHAENYPCRANLWGEPDWKSISGFPFHATRNKQNRIYKSINTTKNRCKRLIKWITKF